MRAAAFALIGAFALAACGDPVAEQARVEMHHEPVRADTMLAVSFAPGAGRLNAGQLGELRAMVAAGRRAERDEFVVVTDGSGGSFQQLHARQVKQSLSEAGARWVDLTVEPAMAMGPDTVVIARSEYRLARNCPDRNTGAMWNPNESVALNYGCADAYNMGQMLARSRSAAVGTQPGPADASVNAAAIARYREGKVRTVTSSVGSLTTGGGGASDAGGGTGAGAGASGATGAAN
jgi:type IV pilus biogenesis protein CpaD/CtpE